MRAFALGASKDAVPWCCELTPMMEKAGLSLVAGLLVDAAREHGDFSSGWLVLLFCEGLYKLRLCLRCFHVCLGHLQQSTIARTNRFLTPSSSGAEQHTHVSHVHAQEGSRLT